jgi:hypothetical protein
VRAEKAQVEAAMFFKLITWLIWISILSSSLGGNGSRGSIPRINGDLPFSPNETDTSTHMTKLELNELTGHLSSSVHEPTRPVVAMPATRKSEGVPELLMNPQDLNLSWGDVPTSEVRMKLKDASKVITCTTPMSLMLHSGFGVERMRALAQEILRRNLITITYRDVLHDLALGQCPASNAIIVSLDDIGTDWIRQDVQQMISEFTARDLVLVLGVIVHGPQDPLIWEYLRNLEGLGNEVASHTINHYNLPQLDQDTLNEEVTGSYRTICEYLEKCPVSLILPYGNIDPSGTILSTAKDYVFVIGIARGVSYSNSLPIYVGRIGPYNDDQRITIQRLEATFDA